MLDLTKACETESELDFLQESFVLTDEQKEAVLQQRIIFWTNAMAEDNARENPVGVVDGFMDNWTEDQRRQFNEDCANDDGLCELEQLPEPSKNQMGEGSKRKRASHDVPLIKTPKTRGVFYNQIGETSQCEEIQDDRYTLNCFYIF